MPTRVSVIALLLLIASTHVQAADFSALVRQVEPSIVRVDAVTEDGSFMGSGFVVDDDVIATNYHVVRRSRIATVTFSDGTTRLVSGFVAVDTDHDIALLKIQTPKPLPKLTLAAGPPAKGSGVVAFGCPEGLNFSVTRGIVSRVQLPKIQHDAAINDGNSGGPLVSENGEVVGINTYRIVGRGVEGLHFAIDAQRVQVAIDKSHRVRPLTTLPDTETGLGEDLEAVRVLKDCRRCDGRGFILCTDKKCKRGVIITFAPVAIGRNPVTGGIIYQTQQVKLRCPKCDGTNQLECPLCEGEGRR